MSDDGPVYTAKVIEDISHGGKYWNTTRVGIFCDGVQIGEYPRNYPSLAETTFFPFELNGQWYALYSTHYTATRIMSLPDCKDLGGEEPKGGGFCPAEFFVPELTGQVLKPDDPQPHMTNHDTDKWAHKVKRPDGTVVYYWPDFKDHPCPDEEKKQAYLEAQKKSHSELNEWYKRNPFITQFAPWGFIAGCYWGDDSSWKIRFVDLSRAAEGILKADDRFGYIELPRGVRLKDAIDTESIYNLNDPPEEMTIRIALPVSFQLTGKRLEE